MRPLLLASYSFGLLTSERQFKKGLGHVFVTRSEIEAVTP